MSDPAERPESSSAELASIARIDDVDRLVSGFLQTRSAEWDVRDAALQRLASLMQDGAALDPSGADFAPQLKTTVSAVVTQLPDLRSQVARSACTTLTALVAHVGDHPALDRPMRESVLPTLLTMSGNGNKVLAGAARECLPQLLVHCHFDGMLKVGRGPAIPTQIASGQPLLPGPTLQVLGSTLKDSKQAAVRQLCCVCLQYALQQWPLEVLSKVGTMLEGVLVAAATDSAVEVTPSSLACAHACPG